MRKWTARLILMLVGACAALALAEILLRTLVPSYVPMWLDVYYLDEHGNMRLRPSQRRRNSTPEWNVLIETNRDGFRDIDVRPQAGEPVILALGDSLAFGWGVEYREMFLTRLEEALGGPASVRIIKAAIPGSGTTDQLSLVRELVPSVKPSVVLLAFYVGNDFIDVAEGGAAQYRIVDGVLIRRTEAPEGHRSFAAARWWLKRHSYVAQIVAQQIWLWRQPYEQHVPIEQRRHEALDNGDYWIGQYVRVHLRGPYPPNLQAGVDRTLAALTEMQQLVLAAHARFIVAAIPRSIQVYDADRRRYQEAFGIRGDNWDMDRPQLILRRWAEEHQAEMLDLLPALRIDAQQTSQRFYYFPDSHMTPAGHARVAEALARYFQETGTR